MSQPELASTAHQKNLSYWGSWLMSIHPINPDFSLEHCLKPKFQRPNVFTFGAAIAACVRPLISFDSVSDFWWSQWWVMSLCGPKWYQWVNMKIWPKASACMRLPDAKWPVFASQNICCKRNCSQECADFLILFRLFTSFLLKPFLKSFHVIPNVAKAAKAFATFPPRPGHHFGPKLCTCL